MNSKKIFFELIKSEKNQRLVSNMLSSKVMGDKFEKVFNGFK